MQMVIDSCWGRDSPHQRSRVTQRQSHKAKGKSSKWQHFHVLQFAPFEDVCQRRKRNKTPQSTEFHPIPAPVVDASVGHHIREEQQWEKPCPGARVHRSSHPVLWDIRNTFASAMSLALDKKQEQCAVGETRASESLWWWTRTAWENPTAPRPHTWPSQCLRGSGLFSSEGNCDNNATTSRQCSTTHTRGPTEKGGVHLWVWALFSSVTILLHSLKKPCTAWETSKGNTPRVSVIRTKSWGCPDSRATRST
jgi:hypothetical protein